MVSKASKTLIGKKPCFSSFPDFKTKIPIFLTSRLNIEYSGPGKTSWCGFALPDLQNMMFFFEIIAVVSFLNALLLRRVKWFDLYFFSYRDKDQSEPYVGLLENSRYTNGLARAFTYVYAYFNNKYLRWFNQPCH